MSASPGRNQVADAARAGRRRSGAAARPRAAARSRACASSGSRPGRRRTASRVSSATRRAIAVRSAASWALRANSMPQPVSATAITSSWPAWMLRRLARQRARADVEDDRQPLAADDVQDLLHEHQALAGGEVRDPAAGEREALGRGWPTSARTRARGSASGVPHRFVRPSATAAWKAAAMFVDGVIG